MGLYREHRKVADKKVTVYRPARIVSVFMIAVFAFYGSWSLYAGEFMLLPWANDTHSLMGTSAQLASTSLLALAMFIVVMLFEWKMNKIMGLVGYISFFGFILTAILSVFY